MCTCAWWACGGPPRLASSVLPSRLPSSSRPDLFRLQLGLYSQAPRSATMYSTVAPWGVPASTSTPFPPCSHLCSGLVRGSQFVADCALARHFDTMRLHHQRGSLLQGRLLPNRHLPLSPQDRDLLLPTWTTCTSFAGSSWQNSCTILALPSSTTPVVG